MFKHILLSPPHPISSADYIPGSINAGCGSGTCIGLRVVGCISLPRDFVLYHTLALADVTQVGVEMSLCNWAVLLRSATSMSEASFELPLQPGPQNEHRKRSQTSARSQIQMDPELKAELPTEPSLRQLIPADMQLCLYITEICACLLLSNSLRYRVR